jgi:hypothetical protein
MKILEFENKDTITVDDIIQNATELKDDLEGIIAIYISKEGTMNLAWSDRKYTEILGILEVAKQMVMEEMRE